MTLPSPLWSISTVWLLVTLLTLLVVDSTSSRNWALVTAMSIMSGVILLRLWRDGRSMKVGAKAAETRQWVAPRRGTS
jgi:hypothetical protein